MIWAEASNLCGAKKSRRRLCQLDCKTNKISYDHEHMERRILPVYRNGLSQVFWFKITEHGDLFRDFIREIRNKSIFMFHSPNAIPRFFEQLGRFFNNPEDIPAIRISISLFSSQDITNGALLSRWVPRKIVHGYSEKAYEHVESWMDAVQNVPCQVEVEVTMQRPWMDYRGLRGLSEQMRRGGRKVHVRINKDAWERCPNSELHIGLTVGALQGITMAQQSSFTEQEAKTLVDHGCRGFRAKLLEG